jgi:hypothetical protein
MAKAKNKPSSFKKKLSIAAIIILAIAIPLTVMIAQKQQEIRQRAAGTECVYAFKAKNVCSSYCAKQENKACRQNINGNWGCCDKIISTENPSSPKTCSRCSDTYKNCFVKWESTQDCTDTKNAKYALDCSCAQGSLDCKLKGVNTSSCLSAPDALKKK